MYGRMKEHLTQTLAEIREALLRFVKQDFTKRND